MRYNTIDCKEKNRMNLGKENEQIKFKESTSELSDALIDITAILNKHNCGALYFGVKNNGDVFDTSFLLAGAMSSRLIVPKVSKIY